MEKKTVRDIDVKGKTILVRCDFNVPMQDGAIQDDTRIKAAIPTIKYLLEQGGKVVLCSHLGKPKPTEMSKEEMKKEFSLSPVAQKLSEELGKDVKFADDLTGDSAKQMISSLSEGEAGLLENTRFDLRETKNDDTLSMELADLADVYVNDAFGSAHRAHSSTEGVAKKMEEQGKETAIGFLMQKEVEELGGVLEKPEKPFVVILGGAKVSSKIGVIKNLLSKADSILIGGKMAVPFLVASGNNVGGTSYDEEEVKKAEEVIEDAIKEDVELILPGDVHIAKIYKDEELTPELVEKAENKTVNIEDGVPKDYQILDIGEQTCNEWAEVLETAKTIVWNGPLGYTEAEEYAQGTQNIARFIAKQTRVKCVIGGGDSVTAINKIKGDEEFDNIYLSTGGGASLEFLAGKALPGIEAIESKKEKVLNDGGVSNQKQESKEK